MALSEYDQRQLKLMSKCVISYEKKLMQLDSLIGNLQALLNVIELDDEEWKDKCIEETNKLEDVNAVAIIRESGEDPGSTISESEAKSIISESISCIKKLINEKFDESEEEWVHACNGTVY